MKKVVLPEGSINQGMTALHTARCPRLVFELVAQGSDPNARDFNERTPLMTVRSARAACALLRMGADINAIGPKGRTVLIHHVRKGSSAAIVRVLLKSGAGRLDRDNDRMTAYDYAEQANNLRLMLLCGVD